MSPVVLSAWVMTGAAVALGFRALATGGVGLGFGPAGWLWVGCIAGALGHYEYVAKLTKAGFDDIQIEPTRVYRLEDARTFFAGEGLDTNALAESIDGDVISAFVRATKRAPASCCGSECCH